MPPATANMRELKTRMCANDESTNLPNLHEKSDLGYRYFGAAPSTIYNVRFTILEGSRLRWSSDSLLNSLNRLNFLNQNSWNLFNPRLLSYACNALGISSKPMGITSTSQA